MSNSNGDPALSVDTSIATVGSVTACIPMLKLTKANDDATAPRSGSIRVPEQDLSGQTLYVPLRTEEIGWEEGGIYWQRRYCYPIVHLYGSQSALTTGDSNGQDDTDRRIGRYRAGPKGYAFVEWWDQQTVDRVNNVVGPTSIIPTLSSPITTPATVKEAEQQEEETGADATTMFSMPSLSSCSSFSSDSESESDDERVTPELDASFSPESASWLQGEQDGCASPQLTFTDCSAMLVNVQQHTTPVDCETLSTLELARELNFDNTDVDEGTQKAFHAINRTTPCWSTDSNASCASTASSSGAESEATKSSVWPQLQGGKRTSLSSVTTLASASGSEWDVKSRRDSLEDATSIEASETDEQVSLSSYTSVSDFSDDSSAARYKTSASRSAPSSDRIEPCGSRLSAVLLAQHDAASATARSTIETETEVDGVDPITGFRLGVALALEQQAKRCKRRDSSSSAKWMVGSDEDDVDTDGARIRLRQQHQQVQQYRTAVNRPRARQTIASNSDSPRIRSTITQADVSAGGSRRLSRSTLSSPRIATTNANGTPTNDAVAGSGWRILRSCFVEAKTSSSWRISSTPTNPIDNDSSSDQVADASQRPRNRDIVHSVGLGIE